MLDMPGTCIQYNEVGAAVGVKDKEGAVAKCEQVVCDPSYVPEKCRLVGKVSTGKRWIVLWGGVCWWVR